MQYHPLASTGLKISALAVGAGPVSQLFVGEDRATLRQVVARAIELGVNWFDTAATYGDGQSERNLGRALAELRAAGHVHVATKVRIMHERLVDAADAVRESFVASLKRLRLERVTLLQIHNAITARAGSQPTSITPAHVLAPGGILTALDRLRAAGLVEHFGLTGIGDRSSLLEVIESGQFATIQIPYNVLEANALRSPGTENEEAPLDDARLVDDCGRRGVAVLAIRVLAGGALAGHPPSPHTLKTPFFPLEVYRRDAARAKRWRRYCPRD